jgi:hypothetical protein
MKYYNFKICDAYTTNRYNGNIAVFDFINNKCKSARDTGDIKYTKTFL